MNFKEFFDRYIRGWLPAEAKMQKHSPIKPIAAILFISISFSLIFILLSSFLLAAPSLEAIIEWDRTYQNEDSDEFGYSVIQTSDGGYAIAGDTRARSSDLNTDCYLIKTDDQGNMEWSQTYGGEFTDRAYSVVATSDGGFAIAGFTYSSGSGSPDYLLIKTDAYGNMEWNQTYGGTQWGIAYSLVVTSDGGYAIAGFTEFEEEGFTCWLVKTDAYGNMEWNQTYGEGLGGHLFLLTRTPEGGYALAATKYLEIDDRGGFWLVKTDTYGNIEWEQTYAIGISEKIVSGMTMTSDGGFALSGIAHDGLLLKIDANGKLEWNQTYSKGDGWEFADWLVSTTDDGYILAGEMVHVGFDEGCLWLVKTDDLGKMEWNQTYGELGGGWSRSMLRTSEGGYVITGFNQSFDESVGYFYSDLRLTKIDCGTAQEVKSKD